jgi:hypothetical protein
MVRTNGLLDDNVSDVTIRGRDLFFGGSALSKSGDEDHAYLHMFEPPPRLKSMIQKIKHNDDYDAYEPNH